MGVMDWNLLAESLFPKEVMELLFERQRAKAEKNYTRADELRNELERL